MFEARTCMLFEEDARRDVQMSQSEHSSLWKCSLFHYHDYQINLKKKLRFYTYSLYNLQTLTDPSSNCSARPSLCVRNSAVRFEQIQFVSEQEKVDEQEERERGSDYWERREEGKVIFFRSSSFFLLFLMADCTFVTFLWTQSLKCTWFSHVAVYMTSVFISLSLYSFHEVHKVHVGHNTKLNSSWR